MNADQARRGNLLIRNARLIDGTGSPPSARVSILIADGRIAAIGRDVQAEAGETLDATGLTVLPGLIDSHVHLYSVPGAPCRGDSVETIRQLQRHHLRAYVACGVTTVLDVGTCADEVRMIQRWLAAGTPGPRALFLAPLFITPNGYLAASTSSTGQLVTPVASPRDVEKRFQESEELGAVGVKVFLESGFGTDRWSIHTPQARAAIQDGAARRSLPLYIHSWTEADTLVALEMQPHALVHAHGLLSDEAISRAKAQAAYVMTTSSIPDAFTIHQEPQRLDAPLVQLAVPQLELDTARQPEAWAKLARGFAAMLAADDASEADIGARARSFRDRDLQAETQQRVEAIRGLHRAGIPIVAGTDSGNWPLMSYFLHGPTTLREIELLGQSGFSAMEAIQAATAVPARMLNLSNEIGTVEVGKQADLLIVRGDPLEDLGSLRSIEWTVLRGIAKTPREWMGSDSLDVGTVD